MTKKLQFHSDNILGWTEQDFQEVKADMANIRLHHGMVLPPQLMMDYAQMPDSIKFRSFLSYNATTKSADSLQGGNLEGRRGTACVHARWQIIKFNA